MGKYIKVFQEHYEYEDYMDGIVMFPNVSHCIEENDVHYNPLPPLAVLYRGDEIIAQENIYYENDAYMGVFLTDLTLNEITYDKVTFDFFNGASNVVVTSNQDSPNIPFNYYMNGNILTIEITNGERTTSWDSFDISYTNIESQNQTTSIIIHANIPA